MRVNYSGSKSESIVALLEPVSNNETEWISEEKISAKYALKFEKIFVDSSNYAGLVGGRGEGEVFFIGEYFSYSPSEGFSIYGDLKHSSEKINFEPEYNGVSYDLAVPQARGSWPVLAVLGGRWEDKYDARIEFIHNSAGFGREDLRAAVSAASNALNPLYLQNLRRFQRSGLEMLGRNYAYVSIRVADPFESRDFNFYSRWIRSFQDDSFLTQLEIDKSFREDFLFFSNLNLATGDPDSEFRLANSWQFLLGIKWGL